MLSFSRGTRYSRADVKEEAGLARNQRGNWDTGIVKHQDEFLIFANIDTAGRTGHDYGNRWEGANLRWSHQKRSHVGWPSVRQLLQPGRRIHVFWRKKDRAEFRYAGLARALEEVADRSPVEILWSFDTPEEPPFTSPEELTPSAYREGAVHKVFANRYERDSAARKACISHHGEACVVCNIRFESRYGERGRGFIHVHHLVPLSELGPDREVNPRTDLRPVCPNCHAMLHRGQRLLSPEELRSLLR